MRLLLSGLLDNLLAPAPDPRRVRFLRQQPYAHRGLHGSGVPENSSAAFVAAMAAGHGIECDVQLSADGKAMVFHDYDLDRMTLEDGPVIARHSAELDSIALSGSKEKIPRLRTMLQSVADRVPVLIEIKSRDANIRPICIAVRRVLEGTPGNYAIMSFNPLVSAWFRRHAPHVVRGLVVTEEQDHGLRGRINRHRNLWIAKPDFLAYDIRDLPSKFASAQRARGLPVLTWTVRNAEQEATATEFADEVIYERAAY
ncbi:MAG: glycerophosphodiester phosphodiesterase family protein [Parasphingorhabdus sp.]|nr:glycerophosphodiester phosphodiesterase family protein [Parasphingorhabdus sp.]